MDLDKFPSWMVNNLSRIFSLNFVLLDMHFQNQILIPHSNCIFNLSSYILLSQVARMDKECQRSVVTYPWKTRIGVSVNNVTEPAKIKEFYNAWAHKQARTPFLYPWKMPRWVQQNVIPSKQPSMYHWQEDRLEPWKFLNQGSVLFRIFRAVL